jgi:hypothetical protein
MALQGHGTWLPPGTPEAPLPARRYSASVDSGAGRDSGKTKLKLLSRALLAVGLTALAAVIIRLRGSGGTPPHGGGWRELSATDLEPVEKK